MMPPERIQLVDENDQPIGTSTRQEAWATGSYYRLVQIILQDENGNFLLQKRSPQKALYPNRWTNAASGHVDEGETYETSAPRELYEEIGIKTPLQYLGKFLIQHKEGEKTINQFNGILRGKISRSETLSIAPEEVSDVKWFSREELATLIAKQPESLTPAALETIRQFILK